MPKIKLGKRLSKSEEISSEELELDSSEATQDGLDAPLIHSRKFTRLNFAEDSQDNLYILAHSIKAH